jgi:hypothetical protein
MAAIANSFFIDDLQDGCVLADEDAARRRSCHATIVEHGFELVIGLSSPDDDRAPPSTIPRLRRS